MTHSSGQIRISDMRSPLRPAALPFIHPILPFIRIGPATLLWRPAGQRYYPLGML